jgi:hypothetical protein
LLDEHRREAIAPAAMTGFSKPTAASGITSDVVGERPKRLPLMVPSVRRQRWRQPAHQVTPTREIARLDATSAPVPRDTGSAWAGGASFPSPTGGGPASRCIRDVHLAAGGTPARHDRCRLRRQPCAVVGASPVA